MLNLGGTFGYTNQDGVHCIVRNEVFQSNKEAPVWGKSIHSSERNR